jgi:hypothetical protein
MAVHYCWPIAAAGTSQIGTTVKKTMTFDLSALETYLNICDLSSHIYLRTLTWLMSVLEQSTVYYPLPLLRGHVGLALLDDCCRCHTKWDDTMHHYIPVHHCGLNAGAKLLATAILICRSSKIQTNRSDLMMNRRGAKQANYFPGLLPTPKIV